MTFVNSSGNANLNKQHKQPQQPELVMMFMMVIVRVQSNCVHLGGLSNSN